ncbi:DAK2 domain-containing protein [Nocardia cyriacigeorgica]|uniref:DAK2 domain-containing protein n=1 Tax=Nocardia cyriacigeorgica TaxID=135487 RepID=A0A6P1D789_9NOCA|nr:DAK2 domain-containing protein [Nocardia cyriacigeorgica]NEW46506.1 DAK2 domain-containing protein [Nocardia cyriacigeorgica]
MRWGRLCLDELTNRREEINALNVFPVADSDTGTNLLATMRAAVSCAEVAVLSAHGGAFPGGSPSGDAAPATLVAAAMARGATSGARGNSGIILSQVLRGMSEATRSGPLSAQTLRLALDRAAVLVREALSVPVEGTILTVLERAAGEAAACVDSELAEVALAAADGAAKALGETPSQLTVLRAAGVVDAGARGLVVLLDCLVEVVIGERPARPVYLPAGTAYELAPVAGAAAPPRYEVMYRLTGSDPHRIAALRHRLTELGDSVVVVGDGERSWSAHVHCVDAGAAVEAGLMAGTLSGVRVEAFAVGTTAESDPDRPGSRDGGGRCGVGGAAESGPSAAHGPGVAGSSAGRADETSFDDAAADRGIVAVAAGDGSIALFEAAGAIVIPGEPFVTSAALLAAIRRMPNREVLVLPNGALAAQELVAVGVAARERHRDVLLLPSGSMAQGLAAIAVHDRGRIAVDDAFAMSEAAAATRWGSLRAATERALTMVGTCEPGDGLGLVGHDVIVIDRDARAAGQTLLNRMLGLGGELVTLLVGAAAPEGLAEELAAHIAEDFPGVEVIVYSGGQHADLIQIGVE